jgi:tight adherence protein B
MVSPLQLSLCAGALLSWPSCAASARLAALAGPARSRSLPDAWVRPLRYLAFGAVPITLAAVFAGLGAAVAAVLLSAACWREWRSRQVARAKILAAEGIAEALRVMVADLRAGAHPVAAAESAAVDAAPEAAGALRLIAASARLDGDLAGSAESGVLGQLARAWSLVRRHGLPMAEVLDAVRRDVVAGVRFARQTHARMAGPRASAAILALLPSVGVGLGQAMGARPLHVLFSTSAGQVLLVAGSGLICAGMAWSSKLTAQAVVR